MKRTIASLAVLAVPAVAGASWHTVWSADDPRVASLSRPVNALSVSPLPLLSVQSADRASVVTLLDPRTTGHSANLTNLVVYRTADGGRSGRRIPWGSDGLGAAHAAMRRTIVAL